jgi:hypothetical protein
MKLFHSAGKIPITGDYIEIKKKLISKCSN